MSIIWTIIVGFLAGVVAKFIMPGSNEPSGFVLTTILGIVGSIVASYLGQALGWYKAGEGAGFIVRRRPVNRQTSADSARSFGSYQSISKLARTAELSRKRGRPLSNGCRTVE